MSRAHAARHRATPSGGIAPRSIFVPVSARRRSVDDRQPGRCGQPCVNRCSRRSVSATRRQPASVSGGPPSTYVITTRPSANSRPSVVGIGTGTVRPSRSRCWRSSVSHARSASFLAPRRPTARCPWTRTLHTSLATPPASGSMRATSSPHCPSAFHPTGDIFAKFRTSLVRTALRESERPESRSPSHVKTLGRYRTANARRRDHRTVGGAGKIASYFMSSRPSAGPSQ